MFLPGMKNSGSVGGGEEVAAPDRDPSCPTYGSDCSKSACAGTSMPLGARSIVLGHDRASWEEGCF